MRKQRKMEYESPQVSEIDLLLTDFMQQLNDSQLKDMNVTTVTESEEDPFWSLQN